MSDKKIVSGYEDFQRSLVLIPERLKYTLNMHNNNGMTATLHNIFLASRDSLTRVVSRLVPPKEIEDIVQETYVRICQLERQQHIEQPRSFMMKTARNLALDHLKRAETRLTDSADVEADFADWTSLEQDATYNAAANGEEFAHFCEAIRLLPVQCRKVFVLKKVYGYSQKEIAVQLQLSESTVEKHVATGVKRCTRYMLEITSAEQTNSVPVNTATRGGSHE